MQGPGWSWVDRFLFILSLTVLLHPVLSSRFYWTLDGPSHVYASSLLHDLMLGKAPADRTWDLNPLPVPNSLGHFLLAILLLPLKAPEALKVMHVLLLASVPCLIRGIAKQHGGIPWSAHIAFPFIVSLPFVQGYYNQCLGTSLLLAVILQFQRTRKSSSRSKWVALAALLLLLYFAHALPFVLALLWIALHIGHDILPGIWRERALSSEDRRLLMQCTLSILPAVACMCWYMVASMPTPVMAADYPYDSRLEQLWLSFVYIDRAPELILWCASLATVFLIVLLGKYPNINETRHPSVPLPGLALLVLLALVLSFGDNRYGNGGDVLKRVALMLHLLLVPLLPSLQRTPRAGAWVALVSLALLIGQTIIRHPEHERRTLTLRIAYEATSAIPADGSAAVVCFDWQWAHIAELGLTGRGITVNSNYELVHDHFPIWNKPNNTDRILALPSDPLDALSAFSNMRGADLRNSGYVVVVDPPRNEKEAAFIDLLDRELSNSHRLLPANGLARIYEAASRNL